MKEKKLKKTYTITETKLNSEYNNGFTVWHKNVEYECKETGARLRISDSVGGCAVQHIYGWSSYANREGILETLEECIKQLHLGVGLVTCQVGEKYNNSLIVKGLIKLGFEDCTYKNYQHYSNGTEIGHYYMLKIEK